MIPISMIVSIDQNFGIGMNNQLLFYIPEDMKRFKQITTGHTVIMGRKTWESLKVKPLPERKNIILTRDKQYTAEGAIIAHTINEALSVCDNDKENFVIGGDMIYHLFFPITGKLYITKVQGKAEADTFFPTIENNEWELIAEEPGNSVKKPELIFSYLTYVRSKK